LLDQAGEPLQVLAHQGGHAEVTTVVVAGEPLTEEIREHAAGGDAGQLGDLRRTLMFQRDCGLQLPFRFRKALLGLVDLLIELVPLFVQILVELILPWIGGPPRRNPLHLTPDLIRIRE
jgi:hypothetical protein